MFRYVLFISLWGAWAFGATLPQNDKLDAVARSKAWERLLHFRHTIPFGKWRSYVDGEGFFFSPEGNEDPRAELEASARGLLSEKLVGKLKQSPVCAFPERARFLREQLGIALPQPKCEKFEEFLRRFEAESVTLVFSSSYPNNPSSMFGHTFLRINRKTDPSAGQQKHDILDHGLNFAAAVADNENPFAFMWFGITGGYLGQFSALPYYTKVNEYSNSESRDIWEYELTLSPGETRRLLAHVWELETNSHFDYYFFDENCSFQLLGLLEAVRPEWDLTNFPLAVIPGEAVKRLVSIPGAVRSVKFRPSLRRRMLGQYELLSPPQREELFSLLDGKRNASATSDTRVLDSTAAYLFYQKQRNEGEAPPEERKLLAEVLTQRSKLGLAQTANDASLTAENRPDIGHDAVRVGLTGGAFSRLDGAPAKAFQEISIKSAYHDLLNDDRGYSPYSEINFPSVSLRYVPSTGHAGLETLELIRVTSLFPMGLLEKKPSWTLQAAYVSPKDLACDNCHAMHAEGGIGVAFNLFSESHRFYVLAKGYLDLSSSLRKGWRVGPELEAAFFFNPLSGYKTRLGASVVFDVFQSDRRGRYFLAGWDHALSLSRNWEIRGGVQALGHRATEGPSYTETYFTLHHYF